MGKLFLEEKVDRNVLALSILDNIYAYLICFYTLLGIGIPFQIETILYRKTEDGWFNLMFTDLTNATFWESRESVEAERDKVREMQEEVKTEIRRLAEKP